VEMSIVAVMTFMIICLLIPTLIPLILQLELFFLNEKSNTVIEYVYIEKPEKSNKINKSKPKVKPVKKLSDLEIEAIDCMVSLGMKKKDAQDKIKNMFSKKKYVSIEDFLMDAYKIND